jgi:colanic acid/amylovoran biosynthesis glycosyltransferase
MLSAVTEVRSPPPIKKAQPKVGTILVFTAELLPFSETFVRDHVTHLRRFDAILVGAREVRGLPTTGLVTSILPHGRWDRMRLWFAGISPAMDRLVKEHGVTAIHAHFADAGARIVRYAKRRGLPLFVTLHGADVLRRPRRSIRRFVSDLLRAEMMRSTDLFLPVSDYLTEEAVDRGFPPERVHRHYLGIPLFPRLTGATSRAGTTPTILFVGRLVEKKGLSFLIRACELLARRGCDFQLRVVGNGPLLERHRAEAARVGQQVEFTGALPPDQVRQALQAADIFCMPSVEARDGDNEGLGLVCLEAQAAGLPVIAFDQGAIPEAIEAGRTGLLARDRSVDDLAACLERLLLDLALRRRMGEEGRRNVERRFDIDQQTKQLEDIYDRVLSRSEAAIA